MMDMGENQYGFTDLRHFMDDHFSGSHGTATIIARQQQQQHYGMILVGNGEVSDQMTHEVAMHSTTTPASAPPLQPPPPPPPPPLNATSTTDQQRMDAFGGLFEDGGSGYSQGRWPRQETLTLLEVRSRLDHKFKESAHKAPLWDEVSRIMAEEHGYQRSGKKCREKLENLYKYYKKTKEGRAGRQDGKHYRFFRQLEALYGENNATTSNHINATRDIDVPSNIDHNFHFQITNMNPTTGTTAEFVDLEAPDHYLHQPTNNNYICINKNLSLNSQHSSEFYSSSSDEDGTHSNNTKKKKKKRRSWKSKIKELVDQQVKKFMDIQELWLQKMLATLESRERERICREEEWRKQEAARMHREHRYWANERAWIDARDAALLEALEKVITNGREPMMLKPSSASDGPEDLTSMDICEDSGNCGDNRRSWSQLEITSLIKLRDGMKSGFRDDMWDEISAEMNGMGYVRSASKCKEKWGNIHKYFIRKRKESWTRTCPCNIYKQLGSLQRSQLIRDERAQNINLEPSPPSTSNAGTVESDDGCFRFLIEGESLWDQHEAMDNNSTGDR